MSEEQQSVSEHSEHHEHVLPLKVYLGIGGALFMLTAITVAVAQVHLGPLNLIVALAIAFLKASLVVLFFMHLLYDNKMFMLVFVSSLLFLSIFISFTLFDTMRRGDMHEEVKQPIHANAAMYDSMAVDTSMHHGEHGEEEEHGGSH